MIRQSTFDIAVIGGGVVGCAVARKFTLEGARTILIEKGTDILSGASKANSALLHTGFDAPTGALELACMKRGYSEYLEIRTKLNLPLLSTGAMVVAWSQEEEAKLEEILKHSHINGILDTRILSRDEVLSREPQLSAKVRAAVLVPGEHVIDPWSAPLAYLRQAVENGSELLLGAEVIGGQIHDGIWQLNTTRGQVYAQTIINCAGLYGDVLEARLLGKNTFIIKPRKGQFVVFDKAARKYLSSIILPVPTERTKGIVLSPTIFGNLLVGPTAEEQESRDDASVDVDTLRQLVDRAAQMMPVLRHMPVTALYAGLRPAAEEKEYRVWSDPNRKWITLGAIRSTGLTSSLGLAEHALELYKAFGEPTKPIKNPIWPKVPNLAEHHLRDWQREGHGEIICHCELVTKREIEAALSGSVPAGDIGGLKRRTRAGMGRCQGFYCQSRIAQLTKGLFVSSLTTGAIDDY